MLKFYAVMETVLINKWKQCTITSNVLARDVLKTKFWWVLFMIAAYIVVSPLWCEWDTFILFIGHSDLSPGQTDMKWLALGGQIHSHVSSQVLEKHFTAAGFISNGQCPVFHWPIGCYNNEWMSLNLRCLGWTWVGLPSGEKLVDLRANLISTKVSASQGKCTQSLTLWPNGVASRSTWSYCLAKALPFPFRSRLREKNPF